VDIRDRLLADLKNNGKYIFHSLMSLWKSCLNVNYHCALSKCIVIGVLISGCGNQGIRLRPSLIFQPHHAEIFLDIFESVLRKN